MDFQNFGGTYFVNFGSPSLEAQYTSGDSISSMRASDVNAASGVAATWGVITEFTYTPVPEPSTFAIFAIGSGLLVWLKMRKNKPGVKKEEACP